MASTVTLAGSVRAGASSAQARFSIPRSARQLIVVSSPTYDPANYLATLRSFVRSGATSPWRQVLGPWHAETGRGHLLAARREGDSATPIGTFAIGSKIYGNYANPGGLHDSYHRLVCGDWWDEDPYTSQYNRFVHVPCQTTPPFASSSEALWTIYNIYGYFAVIDFNIDPTLAGPNAPGSGIFLHVWENGPTHGCVALLLPDLLKLLRWLNPADHPVIEIGTTAQVGSLKP